MTEPTPAPAPGAAPRTHLLEALLLALAFALAHTQSPLYYSNQNQYFLHGLANGGLGNLSHDWLAGTTDPTPVFTALITGGYRYLGEWSFQALYFLMVMGYFLSVRWLVAALPGVPDSRAFRLMWAAGFTATHAAILRMISVKLTGTDYPWYLQAGVAAQYVIGPGLQPSAFGVLVIAGLAAFANRRSTLGCGLVAAACVFHSTHMLMAGSFVLGFLIVLFREDDDAGPLALRGLLVASLLVAPVVAFTLFTFGPRDPRTFETAQHVLADVRIPHHARIDRWLDKVAVVQLAWAALGIVLWRKSRVFVPLAVAAIIGGALAVAQYQYNVTTLALVFPWRVSVILVPVATAAIAARVAGAFPNKPWVGGVGAVALTAFAAGGAWILITKPAYRAGENEEPLYAYVRENSQPDQVYLLPVRIPEVGLGRGAMSASFTAPPRPKPGSNLVPVDLQRFRLHTGTPIYVDFKSMPYYETEVMEWLRRMEQCEEWYEDDWAAPGRLQKLRAEKITHVVSPAAQPLTADYLELVHSDPAYLVYRLK